MMNPEIYSRYLDRQKEDRLMEIDSQFSADRHESLGEMAIIYRIYRKSDNLMELSGVLS